MKYKVTIYEEHVVEVEANDKEEAEYKAYFKHEVYDSGNYSNSWIEKVEELEE